MNILGVIPCRYASVRFPGKALADIGGKTLLQRVYERAERAATLSRLVVATDDERIREHADSIGADVLMTSRSCRNGTERTAEVLSMLDGDRFDAVINIQGDEPLLRFEQLDQLARLIRDTNSGIATLCHELEAGEAGDPNVVKVGIDETGSASGFSRDGDFIEQTADAIYKHVGLYAFRADVLPRLVALQPTPNEKLERLEQLRWIDHGYSIAVGITDFPNHSVDVPEDIHKILPLLTDSSHN